MKYPYYNWRNHKMSNLRIVLFNGGLGNQLYQYAFIRFLELTTGEICLADDHYFFGNIIDHNGFELERIFNVKLNLLSRNFSEDVWKQITSKKNNSDISIPQQLLDGGINLFLIAETNDYTFNGNVINLYNGCTSDEIAYGLSNTKGNVYYHGYFCHPRWFYSVQDVLRKELTFPDIKSSDWVHRANISYEEYINLTNSVSVHIRRGDFVQIGRALSVDRYAEAISYFENKYDDLTYFIFSDDPDWVKENKCSLGITKIKGEVIYVSENCDHKNNYVDMQLMSQCKKMIISNSSFGMWSYYLNKTPGLEVVFADNGTILGSLMPDEN